MPTVETTYTVIGNNTHNCPDTASVTLSVAQPPLAEAGPDLSVCTDHVVLQAALSPNANALWRSLSGAFIQMPAAASTQAEDLSEGWNVFVIEAAAPPCPGVARDTVRVYFSGAAPILRDDDFHTGAGRWLQANVLGNDTLPFQGAATLRLTETDDNGAWSLQADGSLGFVPNSGFHGQAMARYQACRADCPDICTEAKIRVSVLRPEDEVGQTQLVTPNGDGHNEDLVFDYLDQYPDNSIVIFNRWGDVVFRAKPYLNDWVRNHNGGKLPAGTYYYILNVQGHLGLIWGNILLMR